MALVRAQIFILSGGAEIYVSGCVSRLFSVTTRRFVNITRVAVRHCRGPSDDTFDLPIPEWILSECFLFLFSLAMAAAIISNSVTRGDERSEIACLLHDS